VSGAIVPGKIRILGIDPGSQRTGVGIIDVAADGKLAHVHHAAINLLGAEDFPQRLGELVARLGELLVEWQPDEVAIEQVFIARNAMSALKLGHARGAAIATCASRGLKVSEYAAKEVKLALVGRGGADKEQVQHMIGAMLNLKGKLQPDAADALAIAVTHAHVRASAARLGVGVRQAWARR